jgi:hypothetical protein
VCPVCTPGQLKQDGCNACECDAKGQWSCSNTCQTCTPGQAFLANDLCNTCQCDAKGLSSGCTKMSCAAAKPGDSRAAADGCNTCVFTTNNKWECTHRTCEKCTPNATLTALASDGCGTCLCGDDSTWQCKSANCKTCTVGARSIEYVDDCVNFAECGSNLTWVYPPEPACAPCTAGSIKMAGDNCNVCTCVSGPNDFGVWACSKNVCPACTPGASTGDGSSKCNNCQCNAAGSWECKTVKC